MTVQRDSFRIFELLEIDIHSLCNRACWWCPRATDASGVRKNPDGSKVNKKAPTEKVKWILDQAKELEFTGWVDFHRMSEPFLDDRYLEFARYARRLGFRVKVNSNGDILRNDPALCAEVNQLCGFVQIGLYDAKTDAEIAEEKKFWKSRFPDVAALCFSLPVKNLNFRRGSIFYQNAEKPMNILQLPCKTMRGLRIRYDGVVAMCCDDDWNAFDLGNAFETPIADIWWSEKHVEIRNDLRNPGSRMKYKFCSECFLNGIAPRHTMTGKMIVTYET